VDFFADLSIILAAISVVITIVFHYRDRYISRKVNTYNALNELYDAYYSMHGSVNSRTYREKVQFLSKVNRFSTAAIEGMYDMKIIKKQAGSFLKRLYKELMSDLIRQRRSQFHRDTYYSSIEKLLSRLE